MKDEYLLSKSLAVAGGMGALAWKLNIDQSKIVSWMAKEQAGQLPESAKALLRLYLKRHGVEASAKGVKN